LFGNDLGGRNRSGGSALARRGGPQRLPLLEGTPAESNVLLVLAAEVLDRGVDRRDRAVGERAERLEQDVAADVGEERDVLLAALTLLHSLEHLRHPPRALATRGALAAGLVRVELDHAQDRLDD